jgi:hypothetical protein
MKSVLVCALFQSVAGLVVPAVPAVASVATAAYALLRARRVHNEEKAFFSMDWKDIPEDDDGEGCMMLGEETVPNGKVWWVCHEKSDDPRMECSSIDGEWGNPGGMGEEFLCKEKKIVESAKRTHWPFGMSVPGA